MGAFQSFSLLYAGREGYVEASSVDRLPLLRGVL